MRTPATSRSAACWVATARPLAPPPRCAATAPTTSASTAPGSLDAEAVVADTNRRRPAGGSTPPRPRPPAPVQDVPREARMPSTMRRGARQPDLLQVDGGRQAGRTGSSRPRRTRRRPGGARRTGSASSSASLSATNDPGLNQSRCGVVGTVACERRAAAGASRWPSSKVSTAKPERHAVLAPGRRAAAG